MEEVDGIKQESPEEIKQKEKQRKYLSNLLSEYLSKVDEQIHIAERPLYQESVGKAVEAVESDTMTEVERYTIQMQATDASIKPCSPMIRRTACLRRSSAGMVWVCRSWRSYFCATRARSAFLL